MLVQDDAWPIAAWIHSQDSGDVVQTRPRHANEGYQEPECRIFFRMS